MAELIIDFDFNKNIKEIPSGKIYSEKLNEMFQRVQEEENSPLVEAYFQKKDAEALALFPYSGYHIPSRIYNKRR